MNQAPRSLSRSLALAAVLFLAARAVSAVGPPCRPCAGILVEDLDAITADLASEPRIEGDARLYVAWQVDLDGTADPAAFEAVRAAGGTPWMVVRFRTPRPIFQHLEGLEAELQDLARIAHGAGERAHFQILWEPDPAAATEGPAADGAPSGPIAPQERAFLLKRAAVAVTGARADARFLVGPLAPDPDALRALYDEEVAAYVDGVVLEPGSGEELEAARAVVGELDPGKPVVVQSLSWPEAAARTLSLAAEHSAAGAAVTFFAVPSSVRADLRPLKLLAREFQGDLSYDPYTVPRGTDRAWTFVRGEDLGLRVIAETPTSGGAAAGSLELTFDDPHLRSPTTIDLENGQEETVFGQRRTATGLVVPIEEPGAAVLLRLARMTAAELAGIEERVEVEDERQMPVEEILRRLQALEDDQARRLHHYQARNSLHLRFLAAGGGVSIEATYEGDFFFRRDQGFDWVWENFYVNGVKWRGKKLPELPLIQPEKAAALPLEIHLSKEYSYRLRGTATVDDRDCWVIDFKPLGTTAPGRTLYQGTVWVDRQMYARVRTRAVQLGLEGDVISNEETVTFRPVDAHGQSAPWEKESFFLPVRIVGEQLLSVLNATVPVETETQLGEIVINGEELDANREAALASDLTMVRDTDQGLRYLRKDKGGERHVEEEIDTNRLFLAAGVFWDESVDYPIPLAGVNWLALDFKGTGSQVNVFFAGVLATANIAQPRLFGSRWDAGANVFGFFIPRGDQLYRNGREVPGEEIERRTASVSLFLGHPLGNFTKLDFTYNLRYDTFGEADDTAEGFVIPTDTLTHTFRTELGYSRSGYNIRLQGSYHSRSDWEFWGRPGNTEFDPEQEDYTRWQASVAKTWWLPKFMKLGIELDHLDGSDLDRFSSYDFGIFGDSTVAGYPSGLVRAEEANGVHLTYGLNIADIVRIELGGDAVWATNEQTGLEDELLAGIGLEGTLALPWQLLTNFEIGYALDGPGEGGLATRIVFLRLFNRK